MLMCISAQTNELLAEAATIAVQDIRDRLQSPEVLAAADAACAELLQNRAALFNERSRIGFAKLVAALLPRSLPYVRAWLQVRDSQLAFEIHFTLFCYLEELPDIVERDAIESHVVEIVKEYLLSLQSDTAQAGWMSADLLGDHLAPEKALSALVYCLKHAPSASSRRATLHGLTQLVDRLPTAALPALQQGIERAAHDDQDELVRELAGALLFRIRESSVERHSIGGTNIGTSPDRRDTK